MLFSIQFLHFVRLMMLYFKSELLVLVGNQSTLTDLVQIQKRMNTTIPTIIVAINSRWHQYNTMDSFCPDCPTSQLTIIYLDEHYRSLSNYLDLERRDSNRIIFVRKQRTQYTRSEIIEIFRSYNMVMVEINKGNFEVFAWGDSVCFNTAHPNFMSRFKDPSAIFHSNDSNALMFRQEMDRWPGVPITAQISTNLQLYSSTLNLFHIMGKRLNFNLKMAFDNYKQCLTCFKPLHLVKNRRLGTLIDYKHWNFDL